MVRICGQETSFVEPGELFMNTDQLINRIGTLSQEDFGIFCNHMLSSEYGDHLKECFGIKDSFYTKTKSGLASSLSCTLVFLVDYLPYELFDDPHKIPFDNPITRKKLGAIISHFNKSPALFQGGCSRAAFDNNIGGLFFFNHIVGTQREFFLEVAYKNYKKMASSFGLGKKAYGFDITVGVGSPYSYVGNAQQNVISALEYVDSHNEQIAIEYSNEGYKVNRIRQGKYVSSGVGRTSGEIYFPCYVTRKADNICKEFEQLLNSNASEKLLSDFIIENYKYIFGFQYDKIATEVCLRFPELDIAEENRRIDILVHNYVENDWELIELKKKIKLSSTYRGVPVLSYELRGAIEQLKNYYRIMQQERVREHFLCEGIEYYNPTLKLIVGGSKNVSHYQWRQMLSSADGVHLITYDNLINEMKARYEHCSLNKSVF